jgi:UDP-N-acetylglucosamine 2-epimerase (non-hydrolysing)
MKKRILLTFGTRPEAIKMVPIYFTLKKYAHIDTRICITSQHKEMLSSVLNFFDVTADYDLDVMHPNQTLSSLSALIISSLQTVLDDFEPHYMLVHGDTTTCFASSLVGFYNKTKVCHVEAGLRTFDRYAPYPEEINRQLVSKLATIHFSPTQQAKANLEYENIKDNIVVTGNTVIDALFRGLDIVQSPNYSNSEITFLRSIIKEQHKIILVTGHRRENFGQGFENICLALKKIVENNPNVQIIYPVHLNPNVKNTIYSSLGEIDNINLIPPLSYPAFIWLMNTCRFIITDSGGVQEEAPSLGKPVIVMRDNTERPEALEAGTVFLAGTSTNKIFDLARRLINDENFYTKVSTTNNPYGDGHASEKIVDYILADMSI